MKKIAKVQMQKKKNQKNGKMTETKELSKDETISFESLLGKGRKLIKEKSKLYDEITIDANSMSIMLFTSGTTSAAKIVMLSQDNVLSNLYAYQNSF